MAMDMKHPSTTLVQHLGDLGECPVTVAMDHGRALLCVEVPDRLGRPGSTFLCGPVTAAQHAELVGLEPVALATEVDRLLSHAGVGTTFYVYFSPDYRAVSIDYLAPARLAEVLATLHQAARRVRPPVTPVAVPAEQPVTDEREATALEVELAPAPVTKDEPAPATEATRGRKRS